MADSSIIPNNSQLLNGQDRNQLQNKSHLILNDPEGCMFSIFNHVLLLLHRSVGIHKFAVDQVDQVRVLPP
jgi:hypothetical protein